MTNGWSTRRAADGVVEMNAHDGFGWYRWADEGKAYVDACPHCNEKHPPPFDGGCLI